MGSEAARPALREGARPRSITVNAAFALLTQIIGAAFTGGLTVFLARRLGPHGYGILSLALGIAGLVLLPSDFGVSNSVSRFVADHLADRRRAQTVVADGLRLKLGSALIVSIVLLALAGPVAGWYHAPELAWPVRGLAIAVFAQSIMMIGGTFVAIGRTDLQALTAFAESAVQVTVSVALVLAGAGATGAAFGQAVGYLAGAALTLALLAGALGPRILPHSLRFGPDARRIAGYAGVLLVIDGAYTVFNQIDVLVIGSYLGTSAVGLFSAPIQMVVFLGYPGAAVSAGVAPRLSSGQVDGPNTGALISGLRFLLIVQTLLTAFVLGWAPLMIRVALGHGYAGAVPVLRALAPFVFLSGFGALVSIAANYLGEARRRLPIAIATVALNVGADLLLVPRLGVIGGSFGTDAAYALYAPAHLWICQWTLDLDLGGTARTALRTIIAGALATGVLLMFGDALGGPGRILLTAVGGGLAVLVYVVALVVSGELSTSELARLSARVSSNRGRQ